MSRLPTYAPQHFGVMPKSILNRLRQLQMMQMGDPLTNAYLQQDQMARDENEQRYLDLVNGYQTLRSRTSGDLASYGQSMIDDTNRRYDLQTESDLSDLASRGLGASNIGSSIKRANNRERSAELRRVQDDIINRRVNNDLNTSSALYGLIERRNDVQPNANQLAQLSQALGRAGYGGAVGYAGSPAMFQSGMGGVGRPGYASYGGGAYGGGAMSRPSYSAPPTVGGFDDPLSNAQDRYNRRASVPSTVVPSYGGYGGYGMGGFGMPLGIGVGNRLNAVQRVAAAPAAAPSYQGDYIAKTPFGDQSTKAMLAQSNYNRQFIREQEKGGKAGYRGFNHNIRQWIDPNQLAVGTTNLGYSNPVAQAGAMLGGAIGAMPSYTTMGSYSGYTRPSRPTRPAVAPKPRNVRAAAAQAVPMYGGYLGDVNSNFASYV